MKGVFFLALTVLLCAGCGDSDSSGRPETITVFSAASTSQVMEQIARQFEREYGIPVELNFASSGSLVKQMQYGNSADVFISASVKWMDVAEEKELVNAGSRLDLLTNRLVLVSPADHPVAISLDDHLWYEKIHGIIAMGDPAHVPAGVYGKEALEYYGCYNAVADRLSNSASVSSALMLVETGQTKAGIVYENNAFMSEKVVVSAVFPEASHTPIVYPAAIGSSAAPEALRFLAFLSGTYARALFEAYGFIPLTDLVFPAYDTAVSPLNWLKRDNVAPTVKATVLSLKVALVSVLLLLVPCIGLGWLLAKKDFPGKHVLSALVQVPLVIPPVATGYILLVTFGANSALAEWLTSHLGISVSFNWIAAVIASSVVSMPLLVKSVRVAMEDVDARIEDAARTLGTNPVVTFFRVTLPLSLHGIIAGSILCFSRAMGEFGATITFAGNIVGKTRTIPLATFNFIQSPGCEQQAMVLIGVSIVISVGSVAMVEWLTMRKRYDTIR